MRAFVLSCCVALCRSQWPVPFVLGPDTVPNVEVSLDAPSKPLPDVSNEIGKFEADREAKQAINSRKMVRAFNKELGSARLRIAALIDGGEHQSEHQLHSANGAAPQHIVESATSFLTSNIVRVAVASEEALPESALGSVADIEHSRASHEDAWVEAAIVEMSRLTDLVVATAESEISAGLKESASLATLSKPLGFLQVAGQSTHDNDVASSAEANIRVVPASVPYPTVQSLVGSLEARRDISEEFGKAQALSMYMKLLEFENMVLESAMDTFVLKR